MAVRQTIIAVDFDGCLCQNAWPEIGEAREDVISALLERQRRGAKIILWTCRVGERLDAAVQWCTEHGITFDAVNANLPVNIVAFGNDCRKIYADEYWDDKARDPEICDVSISLSGNMDNPPIPPREMERGFADFLTKIDDMEKRRTYVSTVRKEIVQLLCARELTYKETVDVFTSITEEAQYNYGKLNIARFLE